MNLHDIPKENTRPFITALWERALGNFQDYYNNHHPIVLTVNKGQVIHAGFRNGNMGERLQDTDLDPYPTIVDWAARGNSELNWDLVEIIYA